MLIEDFICEIDGPLRALLMMITFIENQIEEEWALFKPKTRESAKNLKAMLMIVHEKIEDLILIREKYNKAFKNELMLK